MNSFVNLLGKLNVFISNTGYTISYKTIFKFIVFEKLTVENIKTLTVGSSAINCISFIVILSILVENDPLITILGTSPSRLFFT